MHCWYSQHESYTLSIYSTIRCLFYLVSVNSTLVKFAMQSVKIDINIERDLAYALKVRECPQILFLRGNRVLYRDKGLHLFSATFHFSLCDCFFKTYNRCACLSLHSFADFRTADELVQMIAFFYYKAKKPLWIDDKALTRPFWARTSSFYSEILLTPRGFI